MSMCGIRVADEPHAVTGIDRRLQAVQRCLLVALELSQALVGVQRPAERDRELEAIGLPTRGGHQETCGVGVAAADRAEQPTGAERVARGEPQPKLEAGALNAAVGVEYPRTPRLRQKVDRLVDEPTARLADPVERGEQLVIGAGRAAQRHDVEDGVHPAAQMAVAAVKLVQLLLLERRQLPGLERGRGPQPLKADLVANTRERQLAGCLALHRIIDS